MWNDVYQQLVEEANHYKHLLSVLKHKQKAVVKGDLATLKAVTAEADQLVRDISAIAEKRHLAVAEALAGIGHPVEQPRLSILAEMAPVSERADWRQLTGKIRSLLKEIARLTRENANLLETASQMNSRFLEALLPQPDQLEMYDRSGNKKTDNSPERMMNRQV